MIKLSRSQKTPYEGFGGWRGWLDAVDYQADRSSTKGSFQYGHSRWIEQSNLQFCQNYPGSKCTIPPERYTAQLVQYKADYYSKRENIKLRNQNAMANVINQGGAKRHLVVVFEYIFHQVVTTAMIVSVLHILHTWNGTKVTSKPSDWVQKWRARGTIYRVPVLVFVADYHVGWQWLWDRWPDETWPTWRTQNTGNHRHNIGFKLGVPFVCVPFLREFGRTCPSVSDRYLLLIYISPPSSGCSLTSFTPLSRKNRVSFPIWG